MRLGGMGDRPGPPCRKNRKRYATALAPWPGDSLDRLPARAAERITPPLAEGGPAHGTGGGEEEIEGGDGPRAHEGSARLRGAQRVPAMALRAAVLPHRGAGAAHAAVVRPVEGV